MLCRYWSVALTFLNRTLARPHPGPFTSCLVWARLQRRTAIFHCLPTIEGEGRDDRAHGCSIEVPKPDHHSRIIRLQTIQQRGVGQARSRRPFTIIVATQDFASAIDEMHARAAWADGALIIIFGCVFVVRQLMLHQEFGIRTGVDYRAHRANIRASTGEPI
jgi:hypothetical protein